MKNIVFFVTVTCLWPNIYADYIAAVVEYTPLNDTSPNSTVETNLREYIHFIEVAKSSKVQIIVFPEYGLTGLVEDPIDYAIEIPTPNSGAIFQNYWLQILSNAAKEHNLYVVINLLEKALSEKNDTVYYSTNIVFDINGVIIAKYRKINLFYERKLTAGNESVQFTTDFGITFGIFTSFDILFYNPSRSILNTSVTDIVYPTAWTSTLPFYHSLSVQSGYASANQVNLLAANLNSPSEGIGGSGIYSYDGTAISYYLSGLNSNKILISTVQPRGSPINPFVTFGFDILGNESIPQSDLQNFATARDFESSKYKFERLDLSERDISKTLCDESFCCSFNISVAETNTRDIYQLLAYNGRTTVDDTAEINIRLCVIIACQTSDRTTCGIRDLNLTTKFQEISVAGHYMYSPDYIYQPVTLTTNLLPIFNDTFSAEKENETNSVSIRSTQIVENLVVFGIFGRGAASMFGSSFIVFVVLSILLSL